MLTKKIKEDEKLPVFGFIIGVELEEGINPDEVMKVIGETLNNYMGTGAIDVELLGQIEMIEDTQVTVKDTNGNDRLEVGPVDMTKLDGVKES